jgi:radical SAM/Cys-rich protein
VQQQTCEGLCVSSIQRPAAELPSGVARMNPTPDNDSLPSFDRILQRHRLGALRRGVIETLQVNVGKLCNQACHHCHVDAGPKRTEIMTTSTAERVMALVEANPGVSTVDFTGGAPELNPSFPFLVERVRQLGRRVIVRCNLTVFYETRMDWVPGFFRRHGVEVVCSLPCYTADNVDRQRGSGVFDRSIDALRWLNRLGYGRPGSGLALDLVYNPVGPLLPPSQPALETRYREELGARFGIEFHRLLTITNMPIKRFAEQLHRWGQYAEYMGVLINHFNPAAMAGLMCRSLLSVGWDGTLYDCDFNQMLDLPLGEAGDDGAGRVRQTIWNVTELDILTGQSIATGNHCFGCTAGAGSSCGGALQ